MCKLTGIWGGADSKYFSKYFKLLISRTAHCRTLKLKNLGYSLINGPTLTALGDSQVRFIFIFFSDTRLQ